MNRLNLELLLSDIEQELLKTNNDEKQASINIAKKLLELVEDDIKIDKELLMDGVIKNIESSSTKELIDETVDIDDIMKNTLKSFNHNFNYDTKNVLKELALIDKTIVHEKNKIFHKIYYLLIIVNSHKESILKLDNLEDENIKKRGVAKTNHPKVDEAIQPKINFFKDNIENNNMPANELGLNMYNDFIDDPLGLITAIHNFDISNIKGVDQSLIDTYNNQKEFLNCNEKIEDHHIFKSVQLYAIMLFKNDKFTNKELANYINIILNDLFKDDIFESNLNRTHITKEIQPKAFFNDFFLLENQTPTNMKDIPIFN